MNNEAGASIKAAYEGGNIYKSETICAEADRNAPEYTRRLLWEKHEMIRRNLRAGAVLLDLCCATGVHLISFAPLVRQGIGIDFSAPFIEKARTDAAAAGVDNVRFEIGDAKALTLLDKSVDTVYSLSALYAIPDVEQVIAEIGRVLRPGGRCVLDFANTRSLGAYCRDHYTEWPPCFYLTVPEMRSMLARNGLSIIEHRAFQILPLWADRPRWLWPLLHPAWNSVLSRRVAGRMLDEWVSNLPLAKRFAFRHMIAVEREG